MEKEFFIRPTKNGWILSVREFSARRELGYSADSEEYVFSTPDQLAEWIKANVRLPDQEKEPS